MSKRFPFESSNGNYHFMGSSGEGDERRESWFVPVLSTKSLRETVINDPTIYPSSIKLDPEDEAEWARALKAFEEWRSSRCIDILVFHKDGFQAALKYERTRWNSMDTMPKDRPVLVCEIYPKGTRVMTVLRAADVENRKSFDIEALWWRELPEFPGDRSDLENAEEFSWS